MRYKSKNYFVVKPRTLRQKVLSRLGFGTCDARPEIEEIEGFSPSWITAHTYISLDWKDRLPDEVLESLKDQRGTILASYGADSPDDVPKSEYQDYIKDADILVDLAALDQAIDIYKAVYESPLDGLIVDLVKERQRYIDKHGAAYRATTGRPFSFDITNHLTQADMALANSNPDQARWQLVKAAERALAACEAIKKEYQRETD